MTLAGSYVYLFVFCMWYNSVVSASETLDFLSRRAAQYSNSTLFWGPYRPNIYVGMGPRLPNSLLSGLMWTNVNDYENLNELRHTCEQSEDIASFGWEYYDARTGGKHLVRDKKMQIDIVSYLVKVPNGKNGEWALRIKGEPRDGARSDLKTTVFFYVGLDGQGELSLQDKVLDDFKLGQSGSKYIRGDAPVLDRFSIEITSGPASNQHIIVPNGTPNTDLVDKHSFLSLAVPHGALWQARDILLNTFSDIIRNAEAYFGREGLPEAAALFQLPNQMQPSANLHYVQQTFQGPFEFDVIFRSSNADETDSTIDLSAEIKTVALDFETQFAETFKFTEPFDTTRFAAFAKELFSNLLGGIGYFHGKSVVDRSYSPSYEEDNELFWESASAQLKASSGQEEGPTGLFSAVPSRAFFPRGFYWDEGFHLMPIGLWDQDLSLEIILSWIKLVDDDGWIGREQILGLEARSRVPPEFTTQYPHHANPPTLFIAIDHFLSRVKKQSSASLDYQADFMNPSAALGSDSTKSHYLSHPELALDFLRSIYADLKKHYDWFRRTQGGEIKAYDREAFSKKEGYRWRGRTPDHCLTSGIDDYPRARPPHTGELHLDLHCWMALMTRSMHNIASQVGENDDKHELARIEHAILRNLDDLYWSEEDQAYCDQTIDDYEESVAVCHIGYISIFPVLLGLLPADHEHLGAVLNIIRDESHLWSPYGLRSLSTKDPYYGTGENYWRGPIWININYLALSSLYRNYVHESGPNQEFASKIYKELRINVVNAVEAEYRRSGIFWEQYNPANGQGQRTKGFTGWTSMVVNIMAEEY